MAIIQRETAVKKQILGRYMGLLRWGSILLLVLGRPGAPAIAAERIFISYSIFGRSISRQSLETFAKEGKISKELMAYARFVSPQQLAQLRESLRQKLALPPVSISQFLYSPTGEILLSRVSQIIQTRQGKGSFYALRSALILAAQDPEGITPLTVLRHYPSEELAVNIANLVGLTREVNQFFSETTAVTKEIQALSATDPLPEPQAAQLLQLKQPGAMPWQKVTLTLKDTSEQRLRYTKRVRPLVTDVYLSASEQPQPVVIISHGLNSDRQSYAYLAEHLASYGFNVVVPEHSGSNKQQIQSLLTGTGRDVAEPAEFLDRPLDIQFLLNTLEALDQTDERFRGKLNLEQVGIIGQSLGGYTSLAAGGAPLAFGNLRKRCGDLNTTLNLSLILQCQALRLPVAQYRTADPRVKAAIAINPITSALFSPTGLAQIKVPVMMVTGNEDIVAPALTEQIEPFSHLTSASQYLVLIRNSNHFSTIAPAPAATESIPQIQGLEGPTPEVARAYIKVLSLAFMQAYLRGQQQNLAYLSPAGAATLSQASLPLGIVTTRFAAKAIPSGQPVPSNTTP
jgi:predicted dienelactone hydrolase